MKTVPLFIYSNGEKIPIGTADVDEVAGELVVMGNITNPNAHHLIRDKEPELSDYSVGFINDTPVEAAYLPLPAIPSNPAFKATISLPIIDPPQTERDRNDD